MFSRLDVFGAPIQVNETVVLPMPKKQDNSEVRPVNLVELKEFFRTSSLLSAMNVVLLDFFFKLSEREGRKVLGIEHVQRMLKTPLSPPRMSLNHSILVMPCQLFLDETWCLVIINLDDESLHYFSPKHRLCHSTVALISRLLAAVYISFGKDYKVGSVQFIEYDFKEINNHTSSDLVVLYYAFQLADGKDCSSLEEYKEFKKKLLSL